MNASGRFQYSLIFDNEVLSSLSSIQPLTAVADPVFNGSEPTEYQDNSGQPLTITVSRCGVLYYDSDLWQYYEVNASITSNVHTYILSYKVRTFLWYEFKYSRI